MTIRLSHFVLIALVVVAAFLVWRNRHNIMSRFQG